MSETSELSELQDHVILVHKTGSDSVTVERQTWGRADEEPTWWVRLQPHDVLDAGYDEAVVKLDRQSIDRLTHWLLTGEVLTRCADVPDPRMAMLRDLARRCHNGAGDPYQEFYDEGMAPLLDRLADALTDTPARPASPQFPASGEGGGAG